MTRELFWLTLTVIMTGLMWVPYILDRVQVRGLSGAMDNPWPGQAPHSAWAERMMKAHTNAVENLVIFATLVLIVDSIGISNSVTVGAGIVYFFARLAHFIVYSAGIPVARTAAFAVGFLAQAALALQILTAS